MVGRSVKVREYMAANPVTVTPDMPILEAIHLLIEHRISGVPVSDLRGNLVGMLSEHDCLRVALQSTYHGEPAGTVREYMSDVVRTVDVDDSIVELAELFLETTYRRFPVMERQRLVGQVSRRDVLRALEQIV
ncbi:MAG: CBS domain-containing protein [Gammaproteobacteria bacterium]|nr:CBS domain-containing protein [Gammaproteobacteria bacterium]